MSHLGSRVSALVDGQLAPAAAERVLAHVAGCAQCAAEVAAARSARRAVAEADDVRPTADLTARLLSLADSSSFALPVAREDPFAAPGEPRSAVGAWDGGPHVLPPHAFAGELGGHRGRRRRAVGVLAGAGAVAAALFVLGDSPWVVPSDEPGQALALLGQASPLPVSRTGTATGGATATPRPGTSTGTGTSASGIWSAGFTLASRPDVAPTTAPEPPAAATAAAPTDYLSWMAEHGWPCPARLPEGLTITAVRLLDGGTLEVDVAGAAGGFVVTEHRGRLDTDALGEVGHLALGGLDVLVLSTAPWHAVWQSGDTVVEVVAESASDTTDQLVATFPPGAYDDGVPARITRGWGTVTQAILQP